MRVFLDSKKREVNNSVKTIYPDVTYYSEGPGEEDVGEVHVNCTPEGIIVDVVDGGEVKLTKSLTIDEFLTLLFEE